MKMMLVNGVPCGCPPAVINPREERCQRILEPSRPAGRVIGIQRTCGLILALRSEETLFEPNDLGDLRWRGQRRRLCVAGRPVRRLAFQAGLLRPT